MDTERTKGKQTVGLQAIQTDSMLNSRFVPFSTIINLK